MLSIVILAKNEAANLTVLLPKLSFADQVWVMDDGSTDNTAMVCQKHGAGRWEWPVGQDFSRARNEALARIKNGWVLFLDADERLDFGLKQEILNKVKQNVDCGYAIKRQDIFYGKELRFGETGETWLVRLAKAKMGRWRGKVHETWEVRRVEKLTHKLKHYSHESVSQLFWAIKGYAWSRAKELVSQGEYWRLDQQIFFPIAKLGYLLIIKRGLLDGWRGLVMSLAMAYHSFLVRWYMRTKPLTWFLIMPMVLLPFGQLLRGNLWGVTIYAHEIFMGLAVLMNGRKIKVELPVLMFSLSLGISYLISVGEGWPLEAGLHLARWGLYLLYGGCLAGQVKQGLRVSIAGLMTYNGIMTVFFGWMQYLLVPDMRRLALLGWDDHYYRMIGSVFDPNFLGLLLILICLWFYFEEKKPAAWMMLGATLAGLAATFSRISYAVAGVCGIVLLGWKRGLIGLAFVLIVVGLLPKPGGEGVNLFRAFSIKSRLVTMETGLKLFWDNPIMGIGFNQYPELVAKQGKYEVEYHPKAPDNSVLFVAATSGLLGLVTFLWMILYWWKTYRDPLMRLSLVAIISHSLANNSFFYPFVLLWWWGLIAYSGQKKVSVNS